MVTTIVLELRDVSTPLLKTRFFMGEWKSKAASLTSFPSEHLGFITLKKKILDQTEFVIIEFSFCGKENGSIMPSLLWCCALTAKATRTAKRLLTRQWTLSLRPFVTPMLL